jgi:hypothetical protein
LAYENASTGLAPNPKEDPDEIHQNMCDDDVITVPADSVYRGAWGISDADTVSVSKGNTYSIDELVKHSRMPIGSGMESSRTAISPSLPITAITFQFAAPFWKPK